MRYNGSMNQSEILKQILIDASLVQTDPTLSWRCFIGKLPDGVGVLDEAVAIIQREDTQDEQYQTNTQYVLHPVIPILVRAVDYQRSYDKARELADFIDLFRDVSPSTDSSICVCATERRKDIQTYKQDGRGRYVLASNINCDCAQRVTRACSSVRISLNR